MSSCVNVTLKPRAQPSGETEKIWKERTEK